MTLVPSSLSLLLPGEGVKGGVPKVSSPIPLGNGRVNKGVPETWAEGVGLALLGIVTGMPVLAVVGAGYCQCWLLPPPHVSTTLRKSGNRGRGLINPFVSTDSRRRGRRSIPAKVLASIVF